ncbi:hypothetical protein FLAV_02805 [Flavobacteriales bacterium]|nr:hypothetical protein FLAV_02805 [Flavobacteriales bacterium]
MMKYEKYKASEIHWLSQIPAHWEVKRVKDLGEYQSGEYINANEFDEENLYPVYGGNSFRGFANKYNTEGDYVLIGRQGALCGNINYGSGKFWATEHCVVVYHKRKINVKWLGELLRIMNLNQYATSTAQPGLSVEKIKRLELPVPSYEEQTAIAQYLDAKTQAIDKKINLLTKKAETYKELRKSIINDVVCKGLDKNVKLKESGIDWIGKIPEHWKISRIKDSFNLFTGNSISDKALFERKENSIDYVSTKDIDVDTGRITYDNGVYIPKKDKSFKIAKANSILICIEGANAGKKIGFTNKDICFVNKLCAIKSRTKNNSDKYFYYFTQSPLFEKQFFAILNGLIGGVSLNSIKYFDIISPTKEEQTSIANYLDEKTQKIDAIVSNIGKQIDTLKELRKTLINDVVTGKIMVNG